MAGEQLSLSDILSDEKLKPEAEAPAPPAEPAAEPDAAAKEAADEQRREDYKSKRTKARDKEAIAQGKVRDPDTGQFVAAKPEAPAAAAPAAPAAAEPVAKPAEAPKPAAAQPEFTDREKAFLRAAQEERTKRQQREKELEEYRAGKTPPGSPAAEPKKFWDDPEAALARHREESVQEARNIAINTRLNTAEMIARSRLPDFEEKVAVFREALSKAGPNEAVLAQQWLSAPDPAMFAYNFGKNQQEYQQVGGLDALREKIAKETEARVRAQIETEQKAKDDALAAQRAALPPSLSDVRAGTGNRPVWSGPESMADILK